MTDLRTPEQAGNSQVIGDEELVAADDRIIGRAFVWSLVVFIVIGAAVGGMALMLSVPMKKQVRVMQPLVSAKSLEHPAASPPLIPFKDITTESGIDFSRENGAAGEKLLPETMGGGCAFLDYDNDENQDILLINGSAWDFLNGPAQTATAPASPSASIPALYRNDGEGHFTNVTSACGLNMTLQGMGVAVGDYDNDGDPDVYITAVGANMLMRNDHGKFVDVTKAAGVAGDGKQWSTSAGFVDYDNDGKLDLFVCRYVKWSREIDFAVNYQLTGIGRAFGPPTNFQGANCALYHNNGDGTFSDASQAAGIEIKNSATGQPMGKALGVAFVNVDRDGRIDIIVANDTVQKFLFHNKGHGEFEEIGATAGVAFDRNGASTGAMGIDSAHYRNDQSLGIAIGNFANEMTSLYVSQGSPMQFADEAITEGIGAPSRLLLKFGVFFFDADLDGRLDLLECNGHLEEQINLVQSSQHYQQPAQLFWNAGPDQKACFAEVPASQVGDLSQPLVGRGAAYADIDHDGDLDVLLMQPRGRPMLLRNDQSLHHHWLRVKLVGNGTTCNRDAIGAWIELKAGDTAQRRQVMPTRSYLSQVELPVTFGIGTLTTIDSLTIEWPDGKKQDVSGALIDSEIVVREDG
jgi:hypothetical protein